MKIKITLFLLTFFIANIKAQLVSYEKIDSFTATELQTEIDNAGFGSAITAGFDVDLYRVLYRTEFLDSTTVISGVVAIPLNTVCKVPLVSYQHGTSSQKLGVPSYNGGEKVITYFFASLGNVVVASDFIGLGASTINLHPYMHHYSQAHSTINLLRATRELKDVLNMNLGNQIYLFGYSQGGSVSAAAVKYIEQDYSDEFKVTAAAPMSGAYNIAGAQYDMVNSGLPYATPGYLPYIMLSYQMMYGNLFNSPSEVFKVPYDTLMPDLLYGHNYGIGYINGQATPVPTDMIKDSVLQDLETNSDNPFLVALRDNDLLSWTPQTPMKLFYCDADEQVNFRNSQIADSVWTYNGAPSIESQNFGAFDHSGCLPFAMINAINYFESFSNNGIEIYSVFNETTGKFDINVLEDDINNYDIVWDDGSTSSFIPNLNFLNAKTVTLTHKTNGCTNSKKFDWLTVVDVLELSKETLGFNMFPNPTGDILNVESLFSDQNLIIQNVLGQEISKVKLFKGKNTLDLSELGAGIYYVQLSGIGISQKLIIEK